MTIEFSLKTFLFSTILLCGCSSILVNTDSLTATREISSVSQNDKVTGSRAEWEFLSFNLNTNGLIYTPFFVSGNTLTLFSGGHGGVKNNGALKHEIELSDHNQKSSEKVIIKDGPSSPYYTYFHAPRVAKVGDDLWMLVEVAGCYNGCNPTEYPKRLAAYQSKNNGNNWTFLGFVKVNGNDYVDKWNANTGLIFNPNGSQTIDLINLTKNRFVTIGDNQDLLISTDGINFTSVKIKHPFSKDRFIFASLIKTRYGYHLTSSSNWSDSYYTTTVRHLFSKDLMNWYILESNSFLRNPNYYKGIHLSYDEKEDRIWALSPCGTAKKCTWLASMKAKDFLKESNKYQTINVGEYVHVDGKTAMITAINDDAAKPVFDVRFSDGIFKNNYTEEMMSFPLAGYEKEGCLDGIWNKLCVGDTVYINKNVASIIGIKKSLLNTKFAVKFSNGEVSANLYNWSLTLPNK